VARLVAISKSQFATTTMLLDWLKIEHGIEKPSTKLHNPFDLDSDALIAEVKKLRGRTNPLTLAALRSLRQEHERTIIPAQALTREAHTLDQQISDLVNAANGLTPAEVQLLWIPDTHLSRSRVALHIHSIVNSPGGFCRPLDHAARPKEAPYATSLKIWVSAIPFPASTGNQCKPEVPRRRLIRTART